MSGVNKVILVGNVGADPELRHSNAGDAVTELSIATSERWTDKQTGEKKEKTEWHRVVFWRRLAEIVAEHVRKGSQLYIEGELYTEKWEKDGIDRYTTKIKARDMKFLGGAQAEPTGQVAQPAQRAAAAPANAQQYAAATGANYAAGGQPATAVDFEEDIPF